MIAGAAELVTVGKIVKPFGVRGDVRVLPLSDVPGRFQTLGQVTLVALSGHTLVTMVTRVREDRGGYVIGVEALTTPEEAAAFRGGWIKIPEDRVPPLPAGQYYEFQLIGMAVSDETGRTLGTLDEILHTGSNPVFVVRGNGREVLVPGTREVIASVNMDERTMTIRLLDGLVNDDHAL
ncbi:MAG: ribosome maturation factor RimM [Nitrospiraceae bacterium]